MRCNPANIIWIDLHPLQSYAFIRFHISFLLKRVLNCHQRVIIINGGDVENTITAGRLQKWVENKWYSLENVDRCTSIWQRGCFVCISHNRTNNNCLMVNVWHKYQKTPFYCIFAFQYAIVYIGGLFCRTNILVLVTQNSLYEIIMTKTD